MRRRGFTMVETMVALSIALIVIGATMVLVLGGFNSFGRTSNSTAYDQAGDGVYGIVRDSLLDAPLLLLSELELNEWQLQGQLPGTQLQNVSCLYLQDGRLWLDMDLSDNGSLLNGEDLMGEDYYLQTQLALSVEATAGNSYIGFDVELLEQSGGTVYHKSSGFNLLNTTPLISGNSPYQYIYYTVNN